jgi:hypothetical protein
MSEREPRAEELREAEALARALEGGKQGDAPGDAAEMAALLRAAGRQGTLSPERSRAVLEDVQRERRSPRWRRRMMVMGTAAAAVALALTATFSLRRSAAGARMPRPQARMIAAQINAARGGNLVALEVETRVYRTAMYASLASRYRRSP